MQHFEMLLLTFSSVRKYINKTTLLFLNIYNIFSFMMISNLVMNIFVPKYFSKLFHRGAFLHNRE